MQTSSHISLYKLPSDTRSDLWNLSMEAARSASAMNAYPMNSFFDSSEFRTVTPPGVAPVYESNMNMNPNILIADEYEKSPESQPQCTLKPLEPMETYAPQDTSDVEALMNHYMSGKHPSLPSSLYDSDDITDIMTSAAALVMMKHGEQIGYGSTAYSERYPDSESESSTDWLESESSDEEDFTGRVTRNSNRRKRKQSSKRTQKGKGSFDMDSTGGARKNSRKKQKTGPGPQSLGKSKHPKTLALSEEKEEANLNQLHQFVRKDLVSDCLHCPFLRSIWFWYQYQLT